MSISTYSVPSEDQGSEAFSGFAYQSHCVARKCIEMLLCSVTLSTICEYHEDFVQTCRDSHPTFAQVKKRESANAWTLSMLQAAIQKLLSHTQFKDVSALLLLGNGRPSTQRPYALAELMVLLDVPPDQRCSQWHTGLKPWVDHLTTLFNPDLTHNDVERGLQLMTIDLSYPHPEAIEAHNTTALIEACLMIWGVSVGYADASQIYASIHCRVQQAMSKPKQPLSVKQIRVEVLRRDVLERLAKMDYPCKDHRMLIDTAGKLNNGQMGNHLQYALISRMNALQRKYELSLPASDWQDLRDEISTAWTSQRALSPNQSGAELWQGLRRVLGRVGETWVKRGHPPVPVREFAEELFFDMLAVCEADISNNRGQPQ